MQWKTVVVCVAFIAATASCALFGDGAVRTAVVPILGGLGIAVAGVMRSAFGGGSDRPN